MLVSLIVGLYAVIGGVWFACAFVVGFGWVSEPQTVRIVDWVLRWLTIPLLVGAFVLARLAVAGR